MRGQRVRFNEAGDGEVDENFWAQAAADQAAGRLAQEECEESKCSHCWPNYKRFTFTS